MPRIQRVPCLFQEESWYQSRPEEILSHESVSSSDDPAVQLKWLSQRNIDWIRESLGRWMSKSATFWSDHDQQVAGNIGNFVLRKTPSETSQAVHTRNHGTMSYNPIEQSFAWNIAVFRIYAADEAFYLQHCSHCESNNRMISWAREKRQGNRAGGVSTGLRWLQHLKWTLESWKFAWFLLRNSSTSH